MFGIVSAIVVLAGTFLYMAGVAALLRHAQRQYKKITATDYRIAFGYPIIILAMLWATAREWLDYRG